MKAYRRYLVRLCRSFGDREITLVELGVKKGETAAVLLAELPKLNYVGIDPYELYSDDHPSIAKWHDNPIPQETWDEHLRTTLENLMPFRSGRWVLYRMKSEQAAKFVPDESIDIGFIDGCHFSCGVDIALWWPKIKPNGVLSGHDFSHPRSQLNRKNRWDVQRAVLDFVAREKLELLREVPIWEVRKPVNPQ